MTALRFLGTLAIFLLFIIDVQAQSTAASGCYTLLIGEDTAEGVSPNTSASIDRNDLKARLVEGLNVLANEGCAAVKSIHDMSVEVTYPTNIDGHEKIKPAIFKYEHFVKMMDSVPSIERLLYGATSITFSDIRVVLDNGAKDAVPDMSLVLK